MGFINKKNNHYLTLDKIEGNHAHLSFMKNKTSREKQKAGGPWEKVFFTGINLNGLSETIESATDLGGLSVEDFKKHTAYKAIKALEAKALTILGPDGPLVFVLEDWGDDL